MSKSIEAILDKAEIHLGKGEMEEAENIFCSVLVVFPEDKRAVEGMQKIQQREAANPSPTPTQDKMHEIIGLYNQGRFQEVLQKAEETARNSAPNIMLFNLIAAANSGLKNLDQAIKNFNKVLEINPMDAMAYFNIGTIFSEKEEFDTAIKNYQKCLAINPNHAEAHDNMGSALKAQGNLTAAVEQFTHAKNLKPNFAQAHYNLGVVLQEKENLSKAIKSYEKACQIKPNYFKAYLGKGNALAENGDLDAAIGSYKQAIKIKPDHAETHYNMGNALSKKGELDAAIESYKQATKIKPDYADAYLNMGNILKDKGDLDAAIDSYSQALKIKPNYAEAYSNLGIALTDKGDLDGAIDSNKKALKIKPDYAEAYYNMGNALKEKSELDAAIDSYKQAIKIKLDYADAYNNMGNALTDKGDLDAAIDSYSQALKIKPDYAEAYSNLGVAQNDKGDLGAAIEAYNKALSLNPDYVEAHLNLSFAYLYAGSLKEGLDEYEWRWKNADFLSIQRHFSQPLWDGEKNLKGKKVLVWCEQGVGDTINWSSCLPLVASQAEYCVLECQEKLVPLLARSFPNVEVKPENRSLDSERDDFDFHVPMGSLYRHFIPKISQNAKADAFLVPDPVRVNFWRERLNSLGNGPFVGVCWKSSVVTPKRLPNYAPISEWAPVLTLPDVTFINLQSKDFVDDLTKIQNELGVTVHNFNDLDHYDNLDDVAALYAALDIVVSNKTTVPLMTAGVGTSTKLANWRQSPWNNILLNPVGASVDIFERNTWEPWDNVFRLIAENIFKLTENWSSRCTKLQ